MNTVEEFTQLKAEWRRKREELSRQGADIMIQALRDVFVNHPEVETISWTQYTPYFNDGDECVFSANTGEPHINGNDRWNYEWENEKSTGEKTGPLSPLYDYVAKILSILDEDDYKEIFGNHVEVTFTKEGYETTEYDHD